VSGDVRWVRCSDELGVALWRTLRGLLGKPGGVGVGASYTSDTYMLTEVWEGDLNVPLLRCESRYSKAHRDEDGLLVRGDGDHFYYLPVREVPDGC
jgi:hypothetical protein